MVSVPVVETPEVGGVPTLDALGLGEPDDPAAGAHTHVVVEVAADGVDECFLPNSALQPPAAKNTPTTTARTATPAAACASRWRRLRSLAARRACCRSSLARASIRSRSLEATWCSLSTTNAAALSCDNVLDDQVEAPGCGGSARTQPARVYGQS